MSYSQDDLVAAQTVADLCQRALTNNATISSIEASDAAQCYRSVVCAFTAEESALIFSAAISALNDRCTKIKSSLEK